MNAHGQSGARLLKAQSSASKICYRNACDCYVEGKESTLTGLDIQQSYHNVCKLCLYWLYSMRNVDCPCIMCQHRVIYPQYDLGNKHSGRAQFRFFESRHKQHATTMLQQLKDLFKNVLGYTNMFTAM